MSDSGPRVLYVHTEGRSTSSRAEQAQREREGLASRRVLVEDAFGFDLLGESTIASLPGIRGALLRCLPMFLAIGIEAGRRRRDYDVIVSWAEKYTIGVAAMLCWRRRRPRHLAILDWVSKPVVRIPLRVVRGGVDRVLTWSSVQARVAVDRLGFRPEQIRHIEHPVDDRFFAPVDAPRIHLASAGETQRDYPTLIAALDGSTVPAVIAARLIGSFSGFRTQLTRAEDALVPPEGISVRAMDPVELRQAYAEAVAVVVPLVESDNNAGISVVLEAMAMGRPVIVSRTVGQVDVIRHGENGLYVRPGDPTDLRSKIDALVADPIAGEEMGRRARSEVLERHRTDDFITAIRDAAAEMVGERRQTARA